MEVALGTRRKNTQMFALAEPPPQEVRIGPVAYRLVKVFKHDFWAATCLYELAPSLGPAGHPLPSRERSIAPHFPRVVVKFGRTQAFCGLRLDFYASWLRRHEEAIYTTLAGIPGIPRWAGDVGEFGYGIEYIDATPLDQCTPPPKFFDALAEIFRAVQARGVAYCDSNKRSNILVAPGGQPYLIDFQIAFRRRPDLPWPLRSFISAAATYMQGRDIYHLYKHKRRMARAELTPEEEKLSYSRGLLHTIHVRLTDPYRAIRRRLLKKAYKSGQLESPTKSLETDHQPEKSTWQG